MIGHRDDLSEKAAILALWMYYIFSSKRGSVAQWFISMPRIITAGSSSLLFPLPSLMGGVDRHYSNKDNQTVAGVDDRGKRGN
jgi:hypothetical protein